MNSYTRRPKRTFINTGFARASVTDSIDYYFAYGSNMNPGRVRLRQMGFEDVLAGRLDGYRLVFNKRSLKTAGAAAANVMIAAGQETEGAIYRLNEPREIERMDPFEGYPRHYDRQVLPIKTERGVLPAWVYVANEGYVAEGLKPARWYLNHLLAGREFLSAGYFNSLGRTVCLPDSDIEPA